MNKKILKTGEKLRAGGLQDRGSFDILAMIKYLYDSKEDKIRWTARRRCDSSVVHFVRHIHYFM